jgi:23S rRNA (adenine2503-C2)-methyltransferase
MTGEGVGANRPFMLALCPMVTDSVAGARTEPGGKTDILSLTRSGLAEAATLAIPEAAGSAGAIYASVFKTGRLDPQTLGLGANKSAAWAGAFRVSSLSPERVIEEPSEFGSTAKALLRLEDGLAIECVRIPMAVREPDEDRATLCVSSQVGCRMACAFCETGRGGLVRSLSAGEIVGQVLAARLALGWRFRNIVFMGMGEPLDNAEAVFSALEVLFDHSGLGFAQDRITLCTVGHVDGLRLLAARPWRRLNLSVSLNAVTDELRSRIMPIDKRWPLAELTAALLDYPKRPNFVLGLNYCLIPGLNDSSSDIEGLASLCKGLGRVLVNLIPYNPGSVPIGRAPSEEEIDTFISRLLASGVRTRRRATRGRSIMAACGQLGEQLRMPARVGSVKTSRGKADTARYR